MAKTPSSPTPAAPKSTLKRWLSILGATAAGLFLIAAIAPFFIPWDKLKDQATAFASEKMGRKLTIEKVEVSLFTGVKLVNVELANSPGFSKDPLFKNASAKLDLSLLSLLTGKVVINAIEFKSPSIVIEKAEDGRYNFSPPATGSAEAPAATKDEKSGAPKELPVVLASLVIQNGTITYIDHAKNSKQSIQGLDLKLLGFSLKSGGDQRLELKFTAETEGKKIPLSLVSNFALDLPKQSVAIKSLDFEVPSVKLSASGSINNFKSPDLDLKATLKIAVATVAKDLLPPSKLAAIPGGLTLDGAISLDLAVKGAAASLEQMDLNGALSFDKVGAKYGDYPALKGLAGTLKFEKSGADLPSLDMDLGGSPVKLAFNAQWGNLDNLLGGASKLKADVSYSLTSPKLILDGIMPILLADDTPEELKQKAETAARTGGILDLSKSVPAGLSLKGSIVVDSLVYKKIKTNKLTQKIVLAKQKLQSATNLDLYGGTFWERTNVDLAKSGPLYSAQTGLSALKFDGLVNDAAASLPSQEALKKLDGKVFGQLSFKANATGKGFKKPALMQNLKADGTFDLKDGKIMKTEWQEKLAAAIPHAQTQAVLRQDLVFQNLRGDFKFSAAKMTLSSLALGSGDDWRGGDIFLQASGTLVPGGAIDFKVVPHFNPAKVQLDGELAKAFEDDKGWPAYNYIAYYGPTTKDAKADFSKGAEHAAKQAVNKKVDEVKQKATDDVKKKIQEQGGDLLKKLPGGLFGQ